MDHIYAALVRAEAEYKAATAACEQVANRIAAINQRLAEKAQARAQIVADAQSGKIDEALSVLRLAVIDADARDLSSFVAQEHQRKAEAAAEVDSAALKRERANADVVGYERSQVLKTLDATVAALEERLLQALVERYIVSDRTNHSLWNLWTPSTRLKEAVLSYRAPV
ncbi:hypothetical protein BURKHO8Y_240255 [Burkholderia sp. 8Y]|uniref:hypothetical protein n=1 Tax=Burkholderia sp. 8Y TaxID=2653133 RepID=UPI0012F31A1A|nr:hypothetical protein [Burkholderia sp. 8Y]VXC60722.1 hypothetical protein BURKHO8Y_240255 [Burkholderia sp. 8Y]